MQLQITDLPFVQASNARTRARRSVVPRGTPTRRPRRRPRSKHFTSLERLGSYGNLARHHRQNVGRGRFVYPCAFSRWCTVLPLKFPIHTMQAESCDAMGSKYIGMGVNLFFLIFLFLLGESKGIRVIRRHGVIEVFSV